MIKKRCLPEFIVICNLTFMAATGLSGCASLGEPASLPVTEQHPPVEAWKMRPQVRRDLFEPPLPTPSSAEIFALDPAIESAFLNYYRQATNQSTPGYKRIHNWLEDELLGFRYDDRTIPIREALMLGRGNCMSLATLTAALARLAGVRHEHQLVRSIPVFDRQHGTLVESDHVRSRVYANQFDESPGQLRTRSFITIDYFSDRPGLSGKRISETRFLAMYYHNLSSEALLDGKISQSFWLAMAALEHDPDFNPALNILALLHNRLGDGDTAEALYRYALETNGPSLDTLTNYSNLLLGQGRSQQANDLKQQRLTLHDPNPYIWIELAEEALSQSLWQAALQYFRNAAEAAPYLPEAFIGQSIAFQRLDRPLAAMRARAQAMELAYSPERKKKFDKKLTSIGQHAYLEFQRPSN